MENKFEAWAIIELMGHKVIAGKVTEQTVGGSSFIRVDVPACDGEPSFTRLLGQASVYGITICDEQTALAAVRYYQPRPMDQWTVREIQRLLPGLPEDELKEKMVARVFQEDEDDCPM